MTWNYRVIRTRDPDGTYVYAIHECFYDNNREDLVPHSYTENPAALISEIRDFLDVLSMIREGVAKPVLEECNDKLYEVEPAIKITP